MGSLKDFAVNGSLVIKKEKILWLNGFLKVSCPPYLAHMSPSILDMRLWSLSFQAYFFVKKFLFSLVQPFRSYSFPLTKFIWKSKAPSEVKAFAWLVSYKVNSNHLPQARRLYKALSPNRCAMCVGSGELIEYLFPCCSMTLRLWHKLFKPRFSKAFFRHASR